MELVSLLEVFVARVANAIELPTEQVRFVVCLFMMCPLTTIIYRLVPPIATLRTVLSIAATLGLTMYCLGPTMWIPSFFASTVCYIMMRFIPAPYAHKCVFAFSMGYLSYLHLYRLWLPSIEWTLDATAPQMIVTIKLTTLAINYYDGNRSAEAKEKMTEFQKQHYITQLPSLFDFYGYIYFLPSFLAGPYLEYVDYKAFMDGTMFKNFPGKQAPNSFLPVLIGFGRAFATVPFLLLGLRVFSVDFLRTEAFYALPLWERMLRFYVHVAVLRIRYYFGWYLSETSFIASGIAYNGKDSKGNMLWNKYRGCYPLAIEFPVNVRAITDNWNVPTAVWLKNYVYNRFPLNEKGQPVNALPTIATYSTSAFWHGFYPGYYLFFLTAALFTETAKLARRKLRPLFIKKDGSERLPIKYVYDIAGVIITLWLFDYAGPAFELLDIPRTMFLWSQVYFAGHAFAALAYIALTFAPNPPRSVPTNSAPQKPPVVSKKQN
eukprot:TRINITY_DN11032_c0_g1_i1.p1 TRINITY_DN11032_c0_g1~~TRINITY_DN11032_c0_g1_i1.p1  ORF type:complete len:501 (+),score=61.39 TRINITY_DN11032_c0_g1_i1:31-1503(+)